MPDTDNQDSKPQVFVSHSHADRDLAFRIVLKLTRKGFNVWWDDLLATGQQIESVFDIIQAADLTLVIWTKNSIKSEWVIDEARTASQQNRYLGLRYESGLELPEEFDGSKLLDLPLSADGSPDILPVNKAVLDRIDQKPREVGLIKAFDLLQKSSDEIVIWNAVRDSSHVNDYKVYLRRYAQNGKFADAARKKVKKLSSPMKRLTYVLSGVVLVFLASASLTVFTLPYWVGAAPFLIKLPQDPELTAQLVSANAQISTLSSRLERETQLKTELETESLNLKTKTRQQVTALQDRLQSLQEALGDVSLQKVAKTGTYQALLEKLVVAEGRIEEQAAISAEQAKKMKDQAAELDQRNKNVVVVRPSTPASQEQPAATTKSSTSPTPEFSALLPNMHAITGGNFIVPQMQGNNVVDPEHIVTLEGFKIAVTEVSRAQWLKCIDSGNCSSEDFPDGYFASSKADLPVTSVSNAQIQTYLDWLNSQRIAGTKPYRLPTEAEWIVAARGGSRSARDYPWGETFKEELIRHSSEMLPVTSGEPVNGLYGMIDNAQERVADCWYSSCYSKLSVVRGAPLRSVNARTAKLTYRTSRALKGHYTFVGFRLAQ